MVSGILLAEGDLSLTGKGRISGAVITGGSLKLEGVVTVAYGKAVVTNSYKNIANGVWWIKVGVI